MMFSKHDQKQWSDPMPFEAEKKWTLSSGKGERTIYAKFSDAAGNWMDEPVSDSIMLISSCPNPRKLNVSSLDSSSVLPARFSEHKIVDDNVNTGWLSPLRLSQRDESITIDLGEMRTVNRVDISSNPFRQFDLFPHDFEMQASTDNTNWVNLFTVENYYPPSSRSESWTFEEIETRYIRMVITRSKRLFMFFYAAYIADIAVYGCTETESPELALSTSPDQTDAGEIEQTLSFQATDKKIRNYGMLPGSKLWKRTTGHAGNSVRMAHLIPGMNPNIYMNVTAPLLPVTMEAPSLPLAECGMSQTHLTPTAVPLSHPVKVVPTPGHRTFSRKATTSCTCGGALQGQTAAVVLWRFPVTEG